LKSFGNKKTILFLGEKSSDIYRFLLKDHYVQHKKTPLKKGQEIIKKCDLAVCFGYRHIISTEVVREFKRPIVNLHISYLPWNRGADPNLWSFMEKTCSGVTIHEIDENIDTGPILAQKEVFQDLQKETLKTSYEKLTREISELFISIWPAIYSNEIQAVKQKGKGSFHRKKDKEKYLELLHSGWNTPVRDIWGVGCQAF